MKNGAGVQIFGQGEGLLYCSPDNLPYMIQCEKQNGATFFVISGDTLAGFPRTLSVLAASQARRRGQKPRSWGSPKCALWWIIIQTKRVKAGDKSPEAPFWRWREKLKKSRTGIKKENQGLITAVRNDLYCPPDSPLYMIRYSLRECCF